MSRIAQIQDAIRAAEKRVGELMDSNEEGAAREEAGRLSVLRENLMQEVADVQGENERLTLASAKAASPEPKTVADHVLGAKAAFSGIEPGFKATAPVADSVSGLDTPQFYRLDLPTPFAPPTGFLSTIPRGTTNGDEHYFQTPVLDNKAAKWVSGVKPESALKWTAAVAHIATVAHWIPIQKQTARRYAQLESIVNGALMTGLALAADEAALNGADDTGILGVANMPGVLSHSKAAGKNIKDTIAAMKRKVRVATGIAPTHVALSPYAIEELSEEKDSTGRYLFPDIANGGTIAGLTVVEDVNMTAVTESASKETAIVYYPGAASWDVADPEEVTVGLQGTQFVENAYTLLAEFTAAFRVDNPACFCRCADLGIKAE